MTNEKDPFTQIEKEFKPSLPKVSEEVVEAISGEFAASPDFVTDIYDRMIAEQFTLTNQIANYISVRARDPEEAQHMEEVLAITYRLLESQAQADTMAESHAVDNENDSLSE